MATSFLNRWSKRKLEDDSANNEVDALDSVAPTDVTQSESDTPADDVTCEPESNTEEQQPSTPSVASLLASEADSTIKKAALRKLFLSGEFSEVDGLNDYDHDYKAVKSLSSEVAEKLRDWMNTEEENPQNTEEALKDDDRTSEANTLEADSEPESESEELPHAEVEEPIGQNIPHNK